jgi:hypothetical protein
MPKKIPELDYVIMGGLSGLREMREDSQLSHSASLSLRGNVTRGIKRKMKVSSSKLHHLSYGTGRQFGYNGPTPWRRVILQNVIITQLVKKFLTFYCTQKFISVLTF